MNNEKNYTNRQKRSIRLSVARQKGTHTKSEWEEMRTYFQHTCALCLGESGLQNVERDHIIPLHMGGSDSIRNIQPLCAKCNSAKSQDINDYREQLCAFLRIQFPLKYRNPY